MEIAITIPDQHIAAALKLGYEKAVSYWCTSIRPFAGEILMEPSKVTDELRRYYWPIFEGKWILLDGVTRTHFPLTKHSIQRGLAVILHEHPRTLDELLSGDIKSSTGDVLIQCSIFGRLIYVKMQDDSGRVKVGHICSECRQAPPCSCFVRELATKRPTVRP